MASNFQRDILRRRMGALPSMMESMGPPTGHQAHTRGRKDYSPLPWRQFFDNRIQVQGKVQGDTFNVYTKGCEGPVIVLLHGGGYSGLSWSCFAVEVSKMIECRIFAPDLRGHGGTNCQDETDYSTETMCQVYSSCTPPPAFLLMGHSMGGALAVHTANTGKIQNLQGIIVVDVVEGSAMDALKGMRSFLMGRPTSFKTQEEAVEWCVRSGTVRNLQSARVSMPSQLKESLRNGSAGVSSTVLEEEPEDGEEATASQQNKSYEWRIDLLKTEPYWQGWFKGLSNEFLSVPAPKLLLLAGVDRLDKDLTVGQMQGKFQMVVLPKVGHAVHEDSPIKVAETVATFCTRNKITKAIGEFEYVFPGC